VRTLIDVPFRDAAADDLAWALERDGGPPAGLATLDVAAGPVAVRLHVLGASHAVELALPDDVRVTETVACGIAGGLPLASAPRDVEDHGLRYAFSAHVDVPGTDAVVALADELHATLTADRHGIVATFPGAPGAATALRARVTAGGVAWDTWHLYPERGEVVRTRSSVVLGAADERGTHAPGDAGAATAGIAVADHPPLAGAIAEAVR